MAEDFEYTDHLQVYMREQAKRFVERMGEHYPPEILDIKTGSSDKLIELLQEGATPILRGMEAHALDAAMGRLIIGIRWAKRHPKSNH